MDQALKDPILFLSFIEGDINMPANYQSLLERAFDLLFVLKYRLHEDFVFPEIVFYPEDDTLTNNEFEGIELNFENDFCELTIRMEKSGKNGGFGEWKDDSHCFKADWEGYLSQKKHINIITELWRFFLPALLPKLKKKQ